MLELLVSRTTPDDHQIQPPWLEWTSQFCSATARYGWKILTSNHPTITNQWTVLRVRVNWNYPWSSMIIHQLEELHFGTTSPMPTVISCRNLTTSPQYIPAPLDQKKKCFNPISSSHHPMGTSPGKIPGKIHRIVRGLFQSPAAGFGLGARFAAGIDVQMNCKGHLVGRMMCLGDFPKRIAVDPKWQWLR